MTTKHFNQFELAPFIFPALVDLGYEVSTPIQEQSIPILLEGKDLLAQAQTGTGKTAAFALPILSKIDLSQRDPQAIIIAPTRELAIQVAEAFQAYAKHMKGFHVAPIYGGQSYQTQLRALKRGVHVIVGTPGRIIDHMEKGTLSVKNIKTLVLDEADKMLKMGFIEDIEWILERIPHHQRALFSATMPSSIRRIAKQYLKEADEIHIKPKENTASSIEQCYIRVAGHQKLGVLTRYLEVEDVDAAIIFARTKTASAELADKLKARGYGAAALNGDMAQSLRERVIDQLKRGALDIVVATDVAARGIDVERIGHVINFDIPHDTESYVHRIGRTGRAGRTGKALLLVTPREHRLLHDIERAINKPIKQIQPPTIKEMAAKRSAYLTEKITNILEKSKHLAPSRQMVSQLVAESDYDPEDIAAALIYLMGQSNPLPTEDIVSAEPEYARKKGKRKPSRSRDRSSEGGARKGYGGRNKDRSRSKKPSSGKGKAYGERNTYGERNAGSSPAIPSNKRKKYR
ncbi:MAG: DEAD/DEAH box helicase [Gammaproteobacteria bacterium]